MTETSTTTDEVVWLVVSRFSGPVDLDDERLLMAIDEAIEGAGASPDDSIIGNLTGPASGSLDDAYDAARGYLTAVPR